MTIDCHAAMPVLNHFCIHLLFFCSFGLYLFLFMTTVGAHNFIPSWFAQDWMDHSQALCSAEKSLGNTEYPLKILEL